MVNLLNKIRHDLNGLQSDDQQTLIQIGAALQQMVSELPAEATMTHELLMSCLYGLQAIYQQTYSDFAHLKQAIETATVAAEQCLGSPGNPVCQMMAQHAKQVLTNALSPTTEGAAEPTPADEANTQPEIQRLPEIHNLDDATAFFMQLQSDDAVALTHFRNALKALSSHEVISSEVKKFIIKAGKLTEQVLRGKADSPAEALNQIGQWLSDAALANEFALHENSSTPARNEPEPAITAAPAPPPPAASSAVSSESTSTAESSFLPADADTALMGEFVVESREYMEGAEAALLALEGDPDDLESVNTVFRAFHTIKGTAAFLGLEKLANLAHHAESLLSRVRDREIRCTGGYADLALRSADTLKELLDAVQTALTGAQPRIPANYDELMRVLANPEAAGISGEKAASSVSQTTVSSPEDEIDEVVVEPIIDEQVPPSAKATTVGAVNNDPRSPARAAATESLHRPVG